MNNLKVDATVKNWGRVYKFLNGHLVGIEAKRKIAGQILIASEEIFVNISHYAYSIGGLGLFMVKKIMDEMIYEHKNSQNNLIITKKID